MECFGGVGHVSICTYIINIPLAVTKPCLISSKFLGSGLALGLVLGPRGTFIERTMNETIFFSDVTVQL